MEHIRKYEELKKYFNAIDHLDVKTIIGMVSLRRFVSGMLSYSPGWIRVLYRIRGIFACLLGLKKQEKPDLTEIITPENLSFLPGERAGPFTVRNGKENIYWVCETPEDKHLKAYFGVVTETPANGLIRNGLIRFHVFTAVKYLHWTGPVYFNIIRPFHHLVVTRMMKAGIM